MSLTQPALPGAEEPAAPEEPLDEIDRIRQRAREINTRIQEIDGEISRLRTQLNEQLRELALDGTAEERLAVREAHNARVDELMLERRDLLEQQQELRRELLDAAGESLDPMAEGGPSPPTPPGPPGPVPPGGPGLGPLGPGGFGPVGFAPGAGGGFAGGGGGFVPGGGGGGFASLLGLGLGLAGVGLGIAALDEARDDDTPVSPFRP